MWPLILQEYDISFYSEGDKDKKKPGDASVQRQLSSFFNTSSKTDFSSGTLAELINNKVKARVSIIEQCITLVKCQICRPYASIWKTVSWPGLNRAY